MATVTISPSGGSDTSALQQAINSTASAGNTLQLQAGNFSSSSLTIPNNAHIQLVSGVNVNYSGGGLHFLNINSSNVVISGASAATSVFQMNRGGADCFRVQNASNVVISGVSGNNAGEDGLYVRTATSVTVNDCIFNNNTRQGSSITGLVNHIYYNRCVFSGTNGHPPMAGIDIEPNAPNEFLQDIVITDCHSTNTQGDGILFSLWQLNNTTPPVSITVIRHNSTNNGAGANQGFAGYRFINAAPTNAPGYILLRDCSTTSAAYWGVGFYHGNWQADGCSVIFKNLTITDPNRNGPESSSGNSSAIMMGGGSSAPLGNAHFINCNISSSGGKTTNYFSFWDNGSSNGPVNMQFVPGTLSGATSTPGLWRSTSYNAIH